MRLGWLVLTAAVIAGCESLKESPPVSPQAAAPIATTPAPAEVIPIQARVPAAPVADTPALPEDSLTLAAECLTRGDEPAAADHLDTYVRLHPEQIMFRAHLAELLLKLDRLDESKRQFEQFVAAAQKSSGPPRSHLVHCHTRLMEIGRRKNDAFAEAFHRGVGMLLLVKEQETSGTGVDDGMREEILCKALTALKEAEKLRPNNSRVPFYLAEAYDLAGNRHGADVARAAARNRDFPNSLTPQEHCRLSLREGLHPGF
jgi:tetratricopeptide (TPR) repeat protein